MKYRIHITVTNSAIKQMYWCLNLGALELTLWLNKQKTRNSKTLLSLFTVWLINLKLVFCFPCLDKPLTYECPHFLWPYLQIALQIVCFGPVRAPRSVHVPITLWQDCCSFDHGASPPPACRSVRVFTVIPPGTNRHKWLSQLMDLLNPAWSGS